MSYRANLTVSKAEIRTLSTVSIGAGPYCVQFDIRHAADGRHYVKPWCYRTRDDVCVSSLYEQAGFDSVYTFYLYHGDIVTVNIDLID